MTRRKTRQPGWLRDSVTGRSLEAAIKLQERSDLERLSVKSARAERVAARNQLPTAVTFPKSRKSNPPKESSQGQIKSVSDGPLSTINPTKLVKSNESAASQRNPRTNKLQNIDPVIPWMRTVAKKMNELTKYQLSNPLDEPIKPMALLSPILITENSGTQFTTALTEVRNEKGEMTIPKQLQVNPGQAQTTTTTTTSQSPRQSPSPIASSSMSVNQQQLENIDPQQEKRLRGEQQERSDVNSLNNPMQNSENDDYSNDLLQNPPDVSSQFEDPNQSLQTNLNRDNEEILSNNDNDEFELVYPRRAGSNPRDKARSQSRTSTTSGISPVPIDLDLFYNPEQPSQYSSLSLEATRRQNEAISRHKPFRYNFQRSPIIASTLYSSLFADTIAAYKNYADLNSGYRYILVVIDALSKKSFVERLAQDSSVEVAPALKRIFMKMGPDLPGMTWFCCDQGKEFMGKTNEVLKEFGMTKVLLTGRHKAAPVERFK